MTSLYELASRALPAEALCGLDEGECVSIDRLARAIEASGYGEATTHRTAILRALGEHLCVQYTDARKVLQWLATLDRRLAVWGACACAHTALRYVPAGEHRPRVAIETAERWLAGQSTVDGVRKARRGAWEAWNAAYGTAAAHAAIYAAEAAYDAADYAASAYAAAHAAHAAYAAACAAACAAERLGTPAWDSAHTAELARLVGVVADALPGLPPEVIA